MGTDSLFPLSALALPFLPSVPQGQAGLALPVGDKQRGRTPSKWRMIVSEYSEWWALFNMTACMKRDLDNLLVPLSSLADLEPGLWIIQNHHRFVKDRKYKSKMKGQINDYVIWNKCFYAITHTSTRLSSCTLVSLETNGFSCSFIIVWEFVISHYETFCDGNTFILTCCLSDDYTLIESISPFLLVVRWALVNPDEKWIDSCVRRSMHLQWPDPIANTKTIINKMIMSLANITRRSATHPQPWCSWEAWLPWVPLRDAALPRKQHKIIL